MTTTAETDFNKRGLSVVITLGVAFAAVFVLLSVFGDEFKLGADGGGHGLSPAATGFTGIISLSGAAGLTSKVGRDEIAAKDAGLLILTPDRTTSATAVARAIVKRRGAPVLVVLPKWQTVPMALHPGWVETTGTIPVAASAAVLRATGLHLIIDESQVRTGVPLLDGDGHGIMLPAPAKTRTIISSESLDPVLTGPDGQMVMAWNAKRNLYILAEPDVINNRGIRDPAAARAAVRLLAAFGGDQAGGLVFDVTLNGFEVGQTLLRTALQPPFLALTLALLIAGALAFCYGLMRFGAPQAPPRAIAFGKVALVDNVAGLIRMAEREADIAPRYATLIGDMVAARLHAPSGLGQAATAAWLEARVAGFAVLAHDAAAADGREDALAAAQALFHWQETMVR